MKTLILTTALVVITALSYAQFPQKNAPDSCCYITEDLRVVVFQNSDSTVSLQMAKQPGEVIKIRIRKDDNKLLYQNRVKSHTIARLTYDLHEFPVGDYTFEIVKDKEVVFAKKVSRNNSPSAIAVK
jgi:hypothetical protein